MMELRKELWELYQLALEDARESHREHANSYGAGYDRGYADALDKVIKIIDHADE